MSLLLTGGGGAGTAPLWTYWNNLWVADADPSRIDPLIPLARQLAIPRAATPGFVGALRDLVTAHGITLVVPTVDEELPVIEALRLFHGIPLLLPDQWFVYVMLDKMTSMATLRDKGIPVPHTTIEKPRHGRGSRGVRVVQERLFGQEYSVQMMADQDQYLRAVVPVRILRKRGITLDGITDDNPRVIAACEAIHEAVPTMGTYNIQGMDTGTAFLPFEINPRLSTTTCLAIAAGADPVAVWEGQHTSRIRHRVGRRLQRFWRTVL